MLADGYFEVKDSGRGISSEKIDAIMQRYTRADTTVGGFGIGLSIVSMIADEYNLSVDISSAEKEWTKVRVSW